MRIKYLIGLILAFISSGCFVKMQLADPNEKLPAIPNDYEFNDTQSVIIFGKYIGTQSKNLMIHDELSGQNNFKIKINDSGYFIEKIPRGEFSLYIAKKNVSEGNCAACININTTSDYSIFEKKLELKDPGIYDLGVINLEKGEVYKHFVQNYSKHETNNWIMSSYSKIDPTKIKPLEFKQDERQ